ncbi:hypothetical protein [Microvirga zambiensis]|uniref:hypothetical protein n=1 Tax=Microvirga zambiensis TaxID=1402137 RepID=UPI00191E8DD7|nr:hypothetical protein [Microvirga zambiensis]
MGIRFDKVLEQVARAANARGDAVDRRAQKVQRLEELIRAKEAMGDRIVICLGLVLALSAVALPVYAVHFSDGQSYLHIADSSTATGKGTNTTQARTIEANPATTGSLSRQARESDLAPGNKGETAPRILARAAPFQRYVIHRATGESALIEGPEGLWWVTPGMTLPGIGQVISIERSDAGWVVLTTETMITQPSTSS